MNVLNRILGGKQKSSNGDSPKESLWQKASSLRQSLRGRPRPRRPASLYLGDGSPPAPGKGPSLRREWGSHRDLSREKRHAAKSWAANNTDDDGGFRSRLRAAERGEEKGPEAWASTSTLPDDQPLRTSGRSLRKLTKDSGYETSVQGEADYVNRDCWTEAERDLATGVESQPPRTTSQGENRRRSLSHYKEAECSIEETAPTPPGDATDGGRTKTSSSTSSPDRQGGQTASSCNHMARLSQQDQDTVGRRFRKGSVYQVLASKSGLDFAPLVHQPRPWVETSADRRIWATQRNAEERQASPPSSPPTPPARSTSSHEKYPSWPVTSLGETPSSTQRSHSWTQETDYPKEKTSGYVRPKKCFKISPHQLQPVLEKACEKTTTSPVLEYTPTRVEHVFPSDVAEASCRDPSEDQQVHSPPERDTSAESYLDKYDDVLRHYQRWNDAPLLQRLYQEGERQGWSHASSGPSGTAGSQEAVKWHGSYSDLSVQMSNRSSLFDSGHSTLPDSGRLSPQSSCDESVTALTEAGHRVVSRLASQAVVAHSARVMQPKRHESESVLYYSAKNAGNDAAGKSTEPTGSGRVSKLRAAFDPLSGSRVSMSSSAASDDTSSERLLFLDPYKKQRVSDPELKAIQKQAVLSFYKRQTSQQEPSSATKNRSLPRHGLPNKFSIPPSSGDDSRCSGKNSSESPGPSSANRGPPPVQTTASSWSCTRSWSVPDLAQTLSLVSSTTSQSTRSPDVANLPTTSRKSEEGTEEDANKTSGPSSLPAMLRTEEERIASGWSEERKTARNSDGNVSQTSGPSDVARGRRALLREVSSNAVKVITAEGVTVASGPDEEPPAVPPRRGGPADLRPPPRPPPKGSTPASSDADDPELKKIAETSALNMNNSGGAVVSGTRCPLPSHLTSSEVGSACSSPDLPLPSPPPPAEPCDDPLPPPPEDLAAADHSTVYPKESYMCYRSERQRSRVEGSYRRGYQGNNNNNNLDVNVDAVVSTPEKQDWSSEGPRTPEDDLHNNNHLGGRLSQSWTRTCLGHRVGHKRPEELECERLSHDLLACCGDAALRSLLVPSPDHKTVSDYMEGLVDMSDKQGNRNGSLCPNTTCEENGSEERLPPSSPYVATPESNGQVTTRFRQDTRERVNECEITKKKEELAGSISRKLEVLRAEQVDLRQEMAENEALGQAVTQRVEALARPNELEKYKLHVEELEKIVHLLLSLSGRLARAHNALGSGNAVSEDERRALEAKREKLSSQHEEARRLKESIDRRSQQVSLLLRRYLTPDEYADYDHFVRIKSKLLVDARELDEKIRLGEEQLAALGTVLKIHPTS